MERDGIWAVYVMMNALAIFFNLSVLVSIWRLKEKRTSTELLIGGLSSGILIGALGCGPQCLMSTVVGTFAFGDNACFAEAYLHLIGMEIQFISVAAISHRTYIGVVKQTHYSSRKAFLSIAFAWTFAIFTTTLMGYFSKYYLVASGTFCFYEWTSPALVFAAWPMAITALSCMGFWYWRTYQAFQTVHEASKDFRKQQNSSGSLDRDLAVRLSLLVFFFLFGYIGIISQSLYEIFVGRAKAWGDIVAALMVLIYWDLSAFCYAHANKRLGLRSVVFGLPVLPVPDISTTDKTPSNQRSASRPESEANDTVESLTPRHSGKKPKTFKVNLNVSPKEIELPSTESSTLRDSSSLGKRGIERLEGPKDYEPFLSVDGEEFVPRPDGRAPSIETEESGKLIFNPYHTQASPSDSCFRFEFNSDTETPSEAPTPRSPLSVTTRSLTTPRAIPSSWLHRTIPPEHPGITIAIPTSPSSPADAPLSQTRSTLDSPISPPPAPDSPLPPASES